MADLEAVLADVSYLMAMEKSKATPAARASKKIVLPEPRGKPTLMSRSRQEMSGRVERHEYSTPVPDFHVSRAH